MKTIFSKARPIGAAVMSAAFGVFVAAEASAALIVSLDPATARFDSLTDNDSGPGGFNAGNPNAAQNAAGLTFNVTFTPAAGDLNSATQAVSLIEVGGDANGSGLYLLGGELVFISKMDGAASTNPSVVTDLVWTGDDVITVVSTFGPLVAGREYTVGVIFDPITNEQIEIGVVENNGGSLTSFSEMYDLVDIGGRTNWSGDDSASAFRGTDIGNFGGARGGGGASPFSEVNINANPFEGTQGQALYWSANASLVPEPTSTLGMLGVAVAAMLGQRRRRRLGC